MLADQRVTVEVPVERLRLNQARVPQVSESIGPGVAGEFPQFLQCSLVGGPIKEAQDAQDV